MEFAPVLEIEDEPKEQIWYALGPHGEAPTSRVGHTCMYLPSFGDSENDKVVILGGANPSGCFPEAHIIDLDAYEWDTPEWEGLLPRYEHASFISSSNLGSIWVFGGAQQSENRNCVQVLNPGSCSWKSPKVEGAAPSPRTFHTSSAAIRDKLYVFGGGDKMAKPVTDPRLHVFDAASMTWTQPETTGEPPQPRHGHIMAAVGTRLFVHGGMAEETFFSDTFCIDTNILKWECLQVKGDIPPACAAHANVVWEKYIYIFGGMTSMGAIDSMYRYDTDTQCWSQMKFNSPGPAGRLDHSMCVIPWKIRTEPPKPELCEVKFSEDTKKSCADENQTNEEQQVHLCLIFGGMNTEGDLFNDCYVTKLQH
ncbi:rab9 effector protein with kelch motifs [Bombina bombina]|uniref:rab9 effector protein with kelch motifs n=1 Tax=Bombina bombina TaxID=8345 RepID=UPI00235AE9A8|nr:rab9 effector protein with kelch motifs [Bombina bombina]